MLLVMRLIAAPTVTIIIVSQHLHGLVSIIETKVGDSLWQCVAHYGGYNWADPGKAGMRGSDLCDMDFEMMTLMGDMTASVIQHYRNKVFG